MIYLLCMAHSEFAVQLQYQSDRRSPARWVLFHAWRHKGIILMLVLGALGNAVLAAVVPQMIGNAFNAMLAPSPAFEVLRGAAFWIIISQLVRAVLQLGRNFGSEIIGQRLERDI